MKSPHYDDLTQEKIENRYQANVNFRLRSWMPGFITSMVDNAQKAQRIYGKLRLDLEEDYHQKQKLIDQLEMIPTLESKNQEISRNIGMLEKRIQGTKSVISSLDTEITREIKKYGKVYKDAKKEFLKEKSEMDNKSPLNEHDK